MSWSWQRIYTPWHRTGLIPLWHCTGCVYIPTSRMSPCVGFWRRVVCWKQSPEWVCFNRGHEFEAGSNTLYYDPGHVLFRWGSTTVDDRVNRWMGGVVAVTYEPPPWAYQPSIYLGIIKIPNEPTLWDSSRYHDRTRILVLFIFWFKLSNSDY